VPIIKAWKDATPDEREEFLRYINEMYGCHNCSGLLRLVKALDCKVEEEKP
jgi:hypothetical protein